MRERRAAPPGFGVLDENDQGVRLRLHSGLYPDEVIFRACYTFTGRYTILLDRADPDHVVVSFSGAAGEADSRSIVGEFVNELIDQRVRADIARETRGIREIIVSQAFAEADLPPAGASETAGRRVR